MTFSAFSVLWSSSKYDEDGLLSLRLTTSIKHEKQSKEHYKKKIWHFYKKKNEEIYTINEDIYTIISKALQNHKTKISLAHTLTHFSILK